MGNEASGCYCIQTCSQALLCIPRGVLGMEQGGSPHSAEGLHTFPVYSLKCCKNRLNICCLSVLLNQIPIWQGFKKKFSSITNNWCVFIAENISCSIKNKALHAATNITLWGFYLRCLSLHRSNNSPLFFLSFKFSLSLSLLFVHSSHCCNFFFLATSRMNNRWEGDKNRAKPTSVSLVVLLKKNRTDRMQIVVLMMELVSWSGHERKPRDQWESPVPGGGGGEWGETGGMRGDRRLICGRLCQGYFWQTWDHPGCQTLPTVRLSAFNTNLLLPPNGISWFLVAAQLLFISHWPVTMTVKAGSKAQFAL